LFNPYIGISDFFIAFYGSNGYIYFIMEKLLDILKWLVWAIIIGVIAWIQKKLFFGKK